MFVVQVAAAATG